MFFKIKNILKTIIKHALFFKRKLHWEIHEKIF
jgi:hypothetical protein